MVSLRIAEARASRQPRAGTRHVLVVGPGRSGTTWIAELLSKTAGAAYLHEPDGVGVPFGGRARAGLGELPFVERDEDAPPDYLRLWDVAFGTRRRWPPNELARRLYARVPSSEIRLIAEPNRPAPSSRLRAATWLARPNCVREGHRRVVKSVNSAFALEWLTDRYNPIVVLVRRHPLDMIASWHELWPSDAVVEAPSEEGYIDERGLLPRLQRWNVPPAPSPDDIFGELVWIVGLMMSAYQEVAEARPEIRVAQHELICADPISEFRRLVADLGLEWTPVCDEYIQSSNAPGTGYETKRLTAKQPGKWRSRLSEDQVRRAHKILAPFPIARLYPELQA